MGRLKQWIPDQVWNDNEKIKTLDSRSLQKRARQVWNDDKTMNFKPKENLEDLKDTIENKIYGKFKKRWLMITIIVTVFIISLVFGGVVFAYKLKYQNKFLSGSRIGDVNISGLTTIEAINLLDQITNKLEEEEIKLIYKDNGNSNLKITPAINALNDPDLSRDLLYFDNHKTIHNAYSFGRDSNMWNNFKTQFQMLINDKNFDAQFTLDEMMMQKLIEQEFSEIETIAKNALPQIMWQDDNYSINLIAEQEGVIIDYKNAIEAVKENLRNLKNQPIEIKKATSTPLIRLADVKNKIGLIDNVLATTTPKLLHNNESWQISKYDLSQIIEFQNDEKNNIVVGLNYELFTDWMEKNISNQINVEPKSASLEMIDGKVTKFEAHRNGKNIDIKKTYDDLNSKIEQGNIEITIPINITTPNIVTRDVNDMGIEEIIGTGHSNFSGSPANRRHNIKTGATKLHGILIKPDEEFSLINALGDIDGENGYLQELVIKGNQTIAEYGGGLCQIGTTVFRAALGSGLPITARRNHSYNVSYYLENGLPGTDATIYNPWPDLKFINDTGNYILIQYEIYGDDLYFNFWGKNDGRKVERTKQKVWGWTSPPPTKYIETIDLPIGVKKCTESSHKGVSASFDYIVTYSNGEKKETTFNSHYKAWQAVCLIGVEKLSSEETATSTEEIIE